MKNLRDVGVPTYKDVRMVGVQKSLSPQIVHRPVRIKGPIAALTKAYVCHDYPHPLTIKVLERRIFLSNVKSIAVAVHSDKGFEGSDALGAFKSAEVTGVPDLVNRFQELPHIVGEDTMGV